MSSRSFTLSARVGLLAAGLLAGTVCTPARAQLLSSVLDPVLGTVTGIVDPVLSLTGELLAPVRLAQLRPIEPHTAHLVDSQVVCQWRHERRAGVAVRNYGGSRRSAVALDDCSPR